MRLRRHFDAETLKIKCEKIMRHNYHQKITTGGMFIKDTILTVRNGRGFKKSI